MNFEKENPLLLIAMQLQRSSLMHDMHNAPFHPSTFTIPICSNSNMLKQEFPSVPERE